MTASQETISDVARRGQGALPDALQVVATQRGFAKSVVVATTSAATTSAATSAASAAQSATKNAAAKRVGPVPGSW